VSFLKLSPQHTLNTLTLESSTDPNPTLARFNNKPIVAPSINLADTQTAKTPILGKTTSNKHIEVDLTNQRLYAYEGVNKVFEFLISSGKWARTPTGKFTIWVKLRATKMEGGKKELGTYYYLPNVPYVMFFANSDIPKWRGFGIHGTYWHSNFGHPMSHGCINMKTEEAEKLYYWTNPDLNGKSSVSSSPENPGTEVFIYGQAPWI
jgi:lipoprotein-anchoring transpeptidase ErfK/SrfK